MGGTTSHYLGIDLGTTNSAAATFDGERVELIRNPQGATLTPSVVRCDARGNFTVGARARSAAERDPENVRSEFKRLMGSPHSLKFAASTQAFTPERLAAEVLRALREDVQSQLGFAPLCAVIGVPALFELPQTAATSEAARLAGFERVELIQEPVASAIAAGWKAESSEGTWLVYDLGGGTFDVSLLETQEGLLRVVAHDGDNFLGGRDFDAALVDWVIERLAADSGVTIERKNPEHAAAVRRLRLLAEDAKIELSRAREAELVQSGLTLGGRSVDLELNIERVTFEPLVEPLIARSLAICERLLRSQGIELGSGALQRIVLVGGPTAMPYLRTRLTEALGAPFETGLDPMTLVAQGAALFAASAGLPARASQPRPSTAPAAQGPRVWLQYPAMSSDLTPYVVGRINDAADRARVAKIVIRRADGSWSSAPEPLDAEGAFATMVNLAPRRVNRLILEGRAPGDDETPLALSPSSFEIVHGVTIGDPPLARTVGVALADDRVRVFFERGSPLPMRRTFTLQTAEALHPGDPAGVLRVPIVQGEFPLAHLCRLVGALEIHARDVKQTTPAGSRVEVTLELDRGGRITSSARLNDNQQVFDGVAHLASPGVPLEQLAARLVELSQRVQAIRARAFKAGMRSVIERLGQADAELAAASRDEQRARGGDADAAEKTRRTLVDVDGALADAEAELAWPELDARISDTLGWVTAWLAQYGSDDERKALRDTITAIERARKAKSPQEIERRLATARQLGNAAYLRSPGAWQHELDWIHAHVAECSDPVRARQLLAAGRAAVEQDDQPTLQRTVRSLWELMPVDASERALAHASGVR